MKAKYYEAVCRSNSSDFQEWQLLDTVNISDLTAIAEDIASMLPNISCMQEEGIMLWYDDNGPYSAIITSGTVEDYRDLWVPIAYGE